MPIDRQIHPTACSPLAPLGVAGSSASRSRQLTPAASHLAASAATDPSRLAYASGGEAPLGLDRRLRRNISTGPNLEFLEKESMESTSKRFPIGTGNNNERQSTSHR